MKEERFEGGGRAERFLFFLPEGSSAEPRTIHRLDRRQGVWRTEVGNIRTDAGSARRAYVVEVVLIYNDLLDLAILPKVLRLAKDLRTLQDKTAA